MAITARGIVAPFGALFGALLVGGAAAQSPPPPPEAFGRLPAISAPRLSPDGQHFSMIQPLDGRPAVAIYQVNAPAGARPAVLTDTNGTIFDAAWGKNDRVIVYDKLNTKAVYDNKIREWTRAYSTDLTATDATTVTTAVKTVPSAFVAVMFATPSVPVEMTS